MERIATLDAKGRVVIPPDLRDELGEHIIIRKTEDGVLLVPGDKEDFAADFLKMVEAGPRRTGRPTNPNPATKSIWNEDR